MAAPALVWGPVATASPAISGISVVEVGTGTLRVSWDVDQPAQGWVEWGYSTGVYTAETTHETSFDYSSHVQDIAGIAAATTVYLVIHAVNAAGQSSSSSEQSATTAAAPGDGITYTDYTVPVGPGWTDGTDCRSALQSWFNSNVPSGTSANDHSRVVFTAGFTWTMSGSLKFNGRSHVTFWGQGTPAYTVDGDGRITACGNTGGGKVKRTHVSPTGDVTNFPAFSTGQGGTAYRATDIRFVGLQVEGGMSAGIDQTANMADGGNEFAHAFDFYGLDGGEVAYCNVYRTTGDAVAANGSAGAVATDPGDVRTRNLYVHHNWFRSTGRVGFFLGKAAAVRIWDNLFQDSAYAFIDFEPDYEHMRIGQTSIARNTFSGRCNWDTSFYMASIFLTRVTSRPGTNWQIDGPVSIYDNVWADLHSRNPGSHEVHASFGPLLKPYVLTFTGNRRVANSHTGPALLLANFQAGWTVTGNTGFGSTSFIATGSGNGGTQTASGNT